MCAGVAVFLFFGTASPALADDPPTGTRAVPQPRAGRAAPPGTSYNELVTYATESAGDLRALQQQAQDVTSEQIAVAAELQRLEALTKRPSLVRDRLERLALRLSVGDTAIDATVPPAVREAAAEMRALRSELEDRSAALDKESAALAPYLAIAPGSGAWRTPTQGELTQRFGPTEFSQFHEGIDIAAPMYTPVTAAAPGRVVWVGRLPDGAMIAIIAHTGGLVSLYAHLDDRVAPPTVGAGQLVDTGQVIGAIGMTGMTTGPHLHFVVWRNGELIDPLSLLEH